MRKLTLEEFITKAKLVHGCKYDYSKVNYINSKTKITIICPEHGEFEQLPSSHLKGTNCFLCEGKSKSTKEEFIIKARRIHGNKYDYSKVSYSRAHAKVIITCPIHGDFKQTPNSHLKGRKCTHCGRIDQISLRVGTSEEFINKAALVHNDKYTYTKTYYVNRRTKLMITCPIHGDFVQNPSNHLQGAECPQCAKTGFKSSEPAILYYLKIVTDDNQVLYKIGITNRAVNERFQLKDLAKIEIVKQKLYEKGIDALAEETRIKHQFKEYQYKGPDILSSGNTELFTEDIMP